METLGRRNVSGHNNCREAYGFPCDPSSRFAKVDSIIPWIKSVAEGTTLFIAVLFRIRAAQNRDSGGEFGYFEDADPADELGLTLQSC